MLEVARANGNLIRDFAAAAALVARRELETCIIRSVNCCPEIQASLFNALLIIGFHQVSYFIVARRWYGQRTRTRVVLRIR